MDILEFINKNDNLKKISEQIYLINPTHSFSDHLEQAHTIYSKISEKLNIPFSHIKVCGSAQTGVSLHKGSHFKKASSDLDIAIIDKNLFINILEKIKIETNSYSNKNLFTSEKYLDQYIKNISLGRIHPKYFPSTETRKEWNSFFHSMTIENKKIYKSISACIYISESSFTQSQIKSLNQSNLIKGKKK